MKYARTITLAIATFAAAFMLAACNQNQPSGQAQENRQQSQDTKSLVNDQPIHHYNWSQIRQTLIDTQDIAASGTATTSFFFNLGSRDPITSCPSLGLPVPNTAQLSNPQQVVRDPNSSNGSVVIGQMDPYGIYAPSASEGTYVICLTAAGKPYVNYWEGPVQTVTVPAVWDYGTHTLKVTGAPTFNVKTKAAK